jgi:lysophospholipase L1-like esterase
MGNSLVFLPTGSSVMDRYAAMLEQDFGVEVQVRDRTVGGQPAHDFLSRLRTSDALREDLAEADVITFLVPNDEWAEPLMTFSGTGDRDPADCGGDDGQQCLRDMVAEYTRLVDEIFAELMAIVDSAEQVVIVQDFHQFHTERRTQRTLLIHPYWSDAQEHLRVTAESYGVPVAGVWTDFMGTDGDVPDLVGAGLVDADGIHLSPAGAQRVAELYHGIGYGLGAPNPQD